MMAKTPFHGASYGLGGHLLASGDRGSVGLKCPQRLGIFDIGRDLKKCSSLRSCKGSLLYWLVFMCLIGFLSPSNTTLLEDRDFMML